jgi:hypothetical protein
VFAPSVFRSLFSRTRVEQELDEELRCHLEREIEERITAGMTQKMLAMRHFSP